MPEKIYTYYSYVRPISFDSCPRSYLIELDNFAKKKEIKPHGILAMGYANYSRKLPFLTISKFELIPEDFIEYVDHFFWEKNDRDPIKAKKFKLSYLKRSYQELLKYRLTDPYAYMTLCLKDYIAEVKESKKKYQCTQCGGEMNVVQYLTSNVCLNCCKENQKKVTRS